MQTISWWFSLKEKKAIVCQEVMQEIAHQSTDNIQVMRTDLRGQMMAS